MPSCTRCSSCLLLAVYSAGRQAARRHHEAMHDRLTGLINRSASVRSSTSGSRRASRAWRSCCSTSTASRTSTTRSATPRRPDAAAGAQRLAAEVPHPSLIARLGGTSSRCCSPGGERRDALAAARRVATRCAARSRSRAWPWTARPASASSCTRRTAPTATRCCSAVTSRCTAPRIARWATPLQPRGRPPQSRAPRAHGGAARSDRRRPARPALPAEDRRAQRPGLRQRGARALGASRARPAAARRVPAAGREHEHDPAADEPRARGGAGGRERLAGERARPRRRRQRVGPLPAGPDVPGNGPRAARRRRRAARAALAGADRERDHG